MKAKSRLMGNGKKIALVVSRFNEYITKRLYESCIETLSSLGVSEKDIKTFWVPGAFEIPFAVKKIAAKNQVDAIIALGCIIKGDTRDFDHLAREVISSLCEINRNYDIPISKGIILAENSVQAIERAGVKMTNKGREAALAALEMANLSI